MNLVRLIFISFLFFSYSVTAQVSFKGYLVDADEKKLKDVEVNLYKGNEKLSSKKWSKRIFSNLNVNNPRLKLAPFFLPSPCWDIYLG